MGLVSFLNPIDKTIFIHMNKKIKRRAVMPAILFVTAFFAGFLPSAQEVLWGLTAPRLELWGGTPQALVGLESVADF